MPETTHCGGCGKEIKRPAIVCQTCMDDVCELEETLDPWELDELERQCLPR